MRTLLLVLSGLIISAVAEDLKIDSHVINVTVFKDRALVTRQAFVDLPRGQHTLLFSDITTEIKDESVRINVPGYNAKILDVKIERRFTTESRRENLKNIQEKIDKLKQQVKIASDDISILNSKKEFVESLKAESGRYYSQTMLLNANATKQWTASIQFIEKNLADIYSDLRKRTNESDQLNEEIRTLEFEKEQLSLGDRKNFKEIIVKIDVVSNSKIELQPTYIVGSTGWYPVYDTRVDTKEKQAELSYYAMVNQSTGEDWHDIKLTLSTADPLTVTSLPELERWVLDTYRRPQPVKEKRPARSSGSNYSIEYDQNRGLASGYGSVSGYVLDRATGEPLAGANVILSPGNEGASTDLNGKFVVSNVDQGSKTLKVVYIGYQALDINMVVREKYNADLMVELDPSMIESEAVMVTAERPLIQKSISQSRVVTTPPRLEFTDAYNKTLSTIFALKTKNSIPSDNNAHKITIFKENLDIDFNYLTIPKVNSKVYLSGKLVNTTDYPLLEGELNVFVDNDFVNRTYTGIIAPTDTFELALGIDENFQVEKNLIKRFVESKGLLGGNKRVSYDLEIKIKNNKKSDAKIEIKDQLPLAANEKIVVELIKPAKEEKILNKNNELIWNLTLKAGEQKIIPLKYYVEFPSDLAVYGLE